MPALELALDPAQAPLLARLPGMGPGGRTAPLRIEWSDTPDNALAAEGLALSLQGRRWRLERLRPETASTPATILAEAGRPALLGRNLPGPLSPVSTLAGTRRTHRWTGDAGEVTVTLLQGQLSTRGKPALCRLRLEGDPPALTRCADTMAEALAIHVPRAGLAAQAMAAVAGHAPPPRALGAPEVAPGQSVSNSLATILGHLADVMLHWADRIPASSGPEPVHQMRVATRRLRSALSVFRHVAACPALDALAAPLKACATRLGTARDWDVFLDGTGAALAETFPEDDRCAAMLRAGGRARRAAYAALRTDLPGPEFRRLTVALACAAALRPWDQASPDERLQQDTAVFAAAVLAKRLKRVRRAGRGIAELPAPALHELRKDCKRLRYTAEFFAPLFPAKPTSRFLKRLSSLQEELGLLNDTAAISGLMGQLGRVERGYAAGLVEGFSAAHAKPARARIVRCWGKFKHVDAFWTDKNCTIKH